MCSPFPPGSEGLYYALPAGVFRQCSRHVVQFLIREGIRGAQYERNGTEAGFNRPFGRGFDGRVRNGPSRGGRDARRSNCGSPPAAGGTSRGRWPANYRGRSLDTRLLDVCRESLGLDTRPMATPSTQRLCLAARPLALGNAGMGMDPRSLGVERLDQSSKRSITCPP